MRNPPRLRRQGGFTILEIVIVFILLAGIMAFVVPKIFQQAGRATSAQAKIEIQHLAGQIEMYRLDVGRYPENLDALLKAPAGTESKWNGPYVKDDDLKDPWGNPFRYTVPGTNKPFDLVSLGADGREGGDGENRDVSN